MARWIIQALGLLTLTGCSAGQPTFAPPEAPVVVHLVRFGWHADLILPNEACNPLPPEAPEHFRAAERIAVGWGDAGYFPKADPGIIAAIRAAVVPSPSVVQIRAVNGPIERTYHAQEILALQIEEEDCARIGTFIRSSDPGFSWGPNAIFYPWVANGENFGLGDSQTSISVQNLDDRDGQIWIFRGDGNNTWTLATTAYLSAYASKTFSAAQLGIAEGDGAPVAVVAYNVYAVPP